MLGRQELTDGQQRIYGYICEYVRAHKYPPTIREIQDNFNFKSANSVCAQLRKLREKGYITNKSKRSNMTARTMQLVDSIMGLYTVKSEELSKAIGSMKRKGYGIGAQEAVELLSILNIKIE